MSIVFPQDENQVGKIVSNLRIVTEGMFLKPPAPKRKALSTLETANQPRGTILQAPPVLDQLGPPSQLTNLHSSITQSLHTSSTSSISTTQPSPLPLQEEATVLSPVP